MRNWETLMTIEVNLWLETHVGARASVLSELNESTPCRWYLSTITSDNHRYFMFVDPAMAVLFKLTWC